MYENNLKSIEKAQNGDKEEMTKLLEDNNGLIWSIVRRFSGRGYEIEDLYQIGSIGFIKAIQRFDTSFEVRLSTYAVPYILGEIKRFIRDDGPIKISRSIKELAYEIIKYKDEYEKKYGVSPSNADIAKSLNINEYQIDYALDSLKEPVSIFEPIYNDGGDTIYLFDQIADKKDFNTDRDMVISLRRAMNNIKDREREVLISRYIFGKTQTELANEYNISQAQVSRIEKNAIDNVRKLIK